MLKQKKQKEQNNMEAKIRINKKIKESNLLGKKTTKNKLNI